MLKVQGALLNDDVITALLNDDDVITALLNNALLNDDVIDFQPN